jgi:protein phosphatase
MSLIWRYAAASDVGLHREGNEDALYAGPWLLAVADGMGGHAAGEVASAAAIAALTPLDVESDGDAGGALRSAIVAANSRLREMVAADNHLHGMGTTVTAALADGDRMVLAHIGDSRAYLLRSGALTQLTRDHTYVQQLVDEGRISAEDVGTHPQRSMITRAVDGRESAAPDISEHEVHDGDRLLICSDGLSGVVSDTTLEEVLRGGSPQDAVEALVGLALRGGAPDNVTVVVADVASENDGRPPIVAGAADDLNSSPAAIAATVVRVDSPATNAARPTSASPMLSRQTHGAPISRARGMRRRRGLVVGFAVLALLAVAALGVRAYIGSQYYVGVDDGQVAIFRGVSGTFAGQDLSRVEETTGIALADLADFVRDDVTEGIEAEDLADAREIVRRLPERTASATPSPSPSPPRSPSTTARPSRSSAPSPSST